MSTELTDAELNELDRLHREATPGPLKSFETESGETRVVGPEGLLFARCDVRNPMSASQIANGCFIAAARDAVPRLVAEVRRLRE